MSTVKGWDCQKLSAQLALIRNGFSGQQVAQITDYPVSRIETISDGMIDMDKVGYVASIPDSYILKAGDILFSNINSLKHIGKVAQVNEGTELFHGMNLLILRPVDEVDKKFLFYKLISKKPWFEKMAVQAINQASINQETLNELLLELPLNKPEQTKIAEVLSTVDQAIEQTEALIAKQQRIKTGLMQDLLTCGIDEHGNLRSEQTHEFKDSPLGRIPVEWEIKRLSELVDEGITYGIVQAGPNIENGVPYIRTGDMSGETINAAQLLKTSERIAKSYKRSAVFSGDIVFALRATVGKVLPVSKELEGSNLTQGTAKISPKKSIESTFLLWALQTAVVQDQIRLHQKGTTFMEITLADLRSIEVALPIMQDEQSTISENLTKHDDLRLQYIQNRQKLHSLKTALMQDLLTGKKRVTPLLKDTEVASL